MNNSGINQSLINGVASNFLSVYDRSSHYGDGIFETILCDVRNVNTRHLFYWSQHYQRLKLSADKLRINCPPEDIFLSDITKLLDQNCSENNEQRNNTFSIKIILTRGESARGYQFSKQASSNRIVLISALDKMYSSLLSGKLLSGDLCFCEQQASINKNLAGLKHLNRLENVMARNEWQEKTTNANIIDGLMSNANGHVIEGCMSNLFAIKDGELFTPDINLSGVNGIMREVIIHLMSKNNIQLNIININQEELFDMDELFITNSLIGIKAITYLENTLYKNLKITTIIFNQILKTMNSSVQNV